jgi:hypothetical protein
MRYVRDQGTGEGFDYDARFSSNSTPLEREIAELRYAAAASGERLRNLQHMAEVQSAEIAESLAEYDHDQANDTGLGGPQRKRKTLSTVDVSAMADQPAYEDLDLGYDSPHDQSGTWGSHAPSSKVPSQMHFTDGSTGPKIRRYKRPRHLQAELDRYEAAVGAPVVKYSPDELAALGLTRSTAPFDLQFLF